MSSVIAQRRDVAVGSGAGIRASNSRLVVCAGAGKHSERGGAADGAGRLAAAVERLLGKSGLACKKLQDGLFEIS